MFLSATLVFGAQTAFAQTLQPVVTLVRSEGTSPQFAREAMASHVAPLAQCVIRAATVDPALLARMRFFNAMIQLSPEGTATSVEISPPLTVRGFSACVAETLLDWRQQGPVQPRGLVALRVSFVVR
jgi:hypothetical protein